MLDAIKFVLNCVAELAKMLFNINIGNGLNLGLLMCIIFIFLPIVHRIICFIKQDAIDELNEKYDESKPLETWSSTEHQKLKTGNGQWFTTAHTRSKSRRYKI